MIWSYTVDVLEHIYKIARACSIGCPRRSVPVGCCSSILRASMSESGLRCRGLKHPTFFGEHRTGDDHVHDVIQCSSAH
mgnify:CR=1 FL=1